MNSLLYRKILGCLCGGVIGDAMGAPVENRNYWEIEEKYGMVTDFDGEGTDDSAVKLILCDAILNHGGHITADEFAESFRKMEDKYWKLFYIPVRNMLEKVKTGLELPVYAGVGNMQSSSSAMAISPMGIINAGNPARAAMETYDVAGLLHAGTTTFCRDAACAMAAAVAEAMMETANVDSILNASVSYLHRTSSAVMRTAIEETLSRARKCRDYTAFRKWFYENRLQTVISDSRETVPAALAVFFLAQGEPERTILYAVNFGRDADTIGTMAGALAGAYRGADGMKREWMDKLRKHQDQEPMAEKLYGVVLKRMNEEKSRLEKLERLAEEENGRCDLDCK